MSSATTTARFTWHRDGGVGHPRPLDAVVPSGRPLLRPIAVDERRGPGRTRGEGAHARPRPDLVGEPGAHGQEPEEREPAPCSSPSGMPGPARHGVQSSSCAARAERSPWRGESPRPRPIAARLARSLHRARGRPCSHRAAGTSTSCSAGSAASTTSGRTGSTGRRSSTPSPPRETRTRPSRPGGSRGSGGRGSTASSPRSATTSISGSSSSTPSPTARARAS